MLDHIKHVGKIVGLVNLTGYTVSTVFETDKITDLFGVGSFGIASLSLANKIGIFAHPLGKNLRLFAATSMITLWSGRLASFLFNRILNLGEDKRLQKFFRDKESNEGWFDKKKSNFPIRLASFWTIQFLWGNLTLLPFTLLASVASTQPIGIISYTALGFAGVGFLIESIADHQKNSFKTKNPNELCTTGLWSQSRHPNYFGELLFWWSMYAFAAPVLSLSQNMISILSPLTITFLLFKVSGIPLLEKNYEKNYSEDYKKWKKTTNLMIPFKL